jgi:hypothetical protein
MIAGAVCILSASMAIFPLGSLSAAPDTAVINGHRLAESLFAAAALPPGAVPTARLPAPLTDGVGDTSTADVHQTFVLKNNVNIAKFVRAHRPVGGVIVGPNTESGSDITTETSIGVSLPVSNRHVAFEGIDYTVGYTAKHVEELRVDVHVDWVPIHTAEMPTTGVLTLTAFGRLSSAENSSDATSVVLTRLQAHRLHDIITSLPNVPVGEDCMEDSTLFTITVAPAVGMSATWTATGDDCPGYLYVTSGTGHISLADTPCSLRSYLLSLLPRGMARATRSSLKVCGPRTI